jgi:small subunit ribosomal protein S4
MEDKKCKICRRAGEKLFLKGEKCFTPKCVFIKKSYAPGKAAAAGAGRKGRKSQTEYGQQLREKQKLRNTYGLREKQFSNYIKKSVEQAVISPIDSLYERLETRLDNVVFNLGFASSRALARQLVSHGHITVGGRKVTIPSYKLKINEVVGIREGSANKKVFEGLSSKLAKHKCQPWLKLESDKLKGEIINRPKIDKAIVSFNFSSVLEFYSR